MLPLLEGLSVFAMTVLLVLAVHRTVTMPRHRREFDRAVASLHSSEFADAMDLDIFPTAAEQKTWSGYWLAEVLHTGRRVHHRQSPGYFVILGAIGAAGIGFIASGSPVVAFMSLLGFPLLLRFWLRREARRRIHAMEAQLPGLLTALRANLQASGTPQSALQAVADDTPSPLGDELRTVKAQMRLNMPMEVALNGLAERVPSEELKFLAASIQIAVAAGADLDPQLKTIGEVVVQRARLAAKIRSAVNSGKPTILLAGLAVPGMFLYSIRSSANRAFWFDKRLGLILTVAVATMYIVGMYICRLQVKNVENT